MAARLGNVLYWAGLIIGVLVAAAGVAVIISDGMDSIAGVSIFVIIPGLIIALLGRAARYILAGD